MTMIRITLIKFGKLVSTCMTQNIYKIYYFPLKAGLNDLDMAYGLGA